MHRSRVGQIQGWTQSCIQGCVGPGCRSSVGSENRSRVGSRVDPGLGPGQIQGWGQGRSRVGSRVDPGLGPG